ncbi:NAD(P)-binding protein [Aspergillus sclerotioniger CBS 115572]|uniref:NAD(P)-binding protein n=1 Tax=Aspergillus sclerotioniger CBS 115572 TaxID=1450535 RepID=A0A317WMY7_9EURO|nr:NAD(P)-binding protein [Aspergillus sclerotioniger CBS 115572]PWY86398.1 NAD(P)-binding protein [Aspergillus sclerotioniger CBS 115572]
MPSFIIYGATGYTGRMASEQAIRIGLDFAIAGRTEQKLKKLASQLQVPYHIFDVNQSTVIDQTLKNAYVLLNCAGPYRHTARPLMEACIRTGTHYLDISAEITSYQQAQELDETAKEAGIMLLPGCGGSVAMLDCLASHALDRVRNPKRIDIALHVAGSMSRGSAMSATGTVAETLHLLDGNLVEYDISNTAEFDFDDGNGPVAAFPVTLPDLLTISRSSNVDNIRTFAHASGGSFPTGDLEMLPDGPTAVERDAAPYHAAVMVTSEDGHVTRAVLHTVNGYTFTSLASVEAAKRVLDNQTKPGFQTPALIFGKDFLRAIPRTEIKITIPEDEKL